MINLFFFFIPDCPRYPQISGKMTEIKIRGMPWSTDISKTSDQILDTEIKITFPNEEQTAPSDVLKIQVHGGYLSSLKAKINEFLGDDTLFSTKY